MIDSLRGSRRLRALLANVKTAYAAHALTCRFERDALRLAKLGDCAVAMLLSIERAVFCDVSAFSWQYLARPSQISKPHSRSHVHSLHLVVNDVSYQSSKNSDILHDSLIVKLEANW